MGSGLVSEAVYLIGAARLPWWHYGTRLGSWRRILAAESALPAAMAETRGLAACMAGIALLTAAYLVGWRSVRNGAMPRWLVWLGALSFAATLFWLMPITADLFVYLSQAHLFTDLGANPWLRAPSEFPADRLIAAYRIVYTDRPSVYGPGWVLLSAVGTLGRHDLTQGLLVLKGVTAAAYLASVWLLERILRQVRPAFAAEGTYLFAWNPLVLLTAVGGGHNDIVMMAAVLLALWCLLSERWALAAMALIFSVWIKYVSIIFVPLCVLYLVRASRGRRLGAAVAQGGLAAMLVTAAVWLPFGSPAWLLGTARRLLEPANWHYAASDLPRLALALGLGAYIVAYGLLMGRLGRRGVDFQGLADGAFAVAALAFGLGAARSQPWHLIWPAALAGLSAWRGAGPLVAGLSVLLLGFQVWVEWGMPGLF
jgi:hypothetical protein